MKIKFILPLLVLGISFILFSFSKDSNNNYTATTTIEDIDIPENIQSILNNKCIGCHSNDAKGGKSKMKMNFDKLSNGDYSIGKTISKLGKVTKMLGKDKMPPQKFLDKYPEKKLSEDEFKLLNDWATEQSLILKGE